MAGKPIWNLGFGIWDLGAVVGAMALCVSVAWADTYAERAAKVQGLSEADKTALLAKKQRFDELKDSEKQRLRQLHEQLSAAPDAAQLQKVMGRYCDWLKSLEPTERATLLSMEPDKRIERIKEIVSRQEHRRFSDYVTFYLPENDRQAIYKWLDDYVGSHEPEILEDLDRDDRRRVREMDDEKAKRRMLIFRLAFRRPGSKLPFPSSHEIETMLAGLTEATQKRLPEAGAEDRKARANELVVAAIWSIAAPPPSEEELRKFYTGLKVEDRARLDAMDREAMQKELRKMHWYARMRGGSGGGFRGGAVKGDDGPRGPRPGGQTQPPGFANPAGK
jgi:hypothetical protein